ncbi:inositol monophosphatase family protein [Luteococcus japonicus]|uniref:Inositol-1-monophosphatase n=1 Tax=Luteococcus japonicus LSP_Lj1 TaxID=1255658 RepID=A0A1R4J1Z2_9ACTN|nr:inositol monophosphatase family protein [Luteococcus japonicus]SJN26180.1 Inositol-1-monophosphatase [Luteococcus japonicus LSP_Lj1]
MITVVAHRGDSESARENTAEAFAAAVEAGADVVELDIRTTGDGTSVVLHDATLLRLWGVANRADEMVIGRGIPVPTLAETLTQFAELNRKRRHPVTMLIDTVSIHDVRGALQVVQRFQQGPDAELVPISWCGDTDALLLVREQLPQADLAYNHDGGELDLAMVHRLQPSAINVEWVHLTEPLVDQVHRMGLELACWTINDAEAMSLAIDLGVDRITTDRPRLLRRLLTGGTSPLALAGLETHGFATQAGISLEAARWIRVARDLAQWTNAFTRTAPMGNIGSKAHAADLVTEVDLAVEGHVREVIAEAFGGEHLVVGEEMGGSTQDGRPTWYLDPVDGTTNLANGLPWTSMSLALAIDGEAVVGSVAQPAMGHVFLAARGLGATLDGEPLELSPVQALAGRTLLTELDAHRRWPGMDGFLDALAAEHCTARIMGSGTLTLTGIAAGWGAAGVVHRFNPIDHLAGVLIAHEAGAEVVDLQGQPTLFPATGGVVVAAPGAARMVVDLLEPARLTS